MSYFNKSFDKLYETLLNIKMIIKDKNKTYRNEQKAHILKPEEPIFLSGLAHIEYSKSNGMESRLIRF